MNDVDPASTSALISGVQKEDREINFTAYLKSWKNREKPHKFPSHICVLRRGTTQQRYTYIAPHTVYFRHIRTLRRWVVLVGFEHPAFLVFCPVSRIDLPSLKILSVWGLFSRQIFWIDVTAELSEHLVLEKFKEWSVECFFDTVGNVVAVTSNYEVKLEFV